MEDTNNDVTSPQFAVKDVMWHPHAKPLNPLDVMEDNTFGRSFTAMLDSPQNQRRRSNKRMQMMETRDVRRASEFEEKYYNDKKKFFQELEHYRRGVTKALEQLSNYMSAGAFHAFRMSLQLDVRYLTEHGGEDEAELQGLAGGGSALGGRSSFTGGGGGMDTDQAKLIARLEQDLAQAEREITRLQTELRKGGKNLAADLTTKGAANKIFRDSTMQTMPMEMPVASAGPGAPTAAASGPNDPGDPKKKKPRSGPAAAGAAEESDEDDTAQAVARKVKKAKGPSEEVGGDDEAINTLKAQVDRERRLRKELEAKVKELEDSIAALRKEIKELQGANSAKAEQIEKLKARIAALEAALEKMGGAIPTGSPVVGDAPKKVESAAVEEADEDVAGPSKKKPPKKSATAKRPTGGGSAPNMGSGGSRGGGRDGAGGGVGGVADGPGGVADEAPKEPVEVETADKCVGNGPGMGLQDEPCKMRGKALKKHPEDLNKTGLVFQTAVRSSPDLGGLTAVSKSAGTMGSTDSLPLMYKRKSTHGISRSSWGSVATASSKPSLGRTYTIDPSAEPYLLEVWDKWPSLQDSPSKRELIKLGATAPTFEPTTSMDSTMSPARARAACRPKTSVM